LVSQVPRHLFLVPALLTTTAKLPSGNSLPHETLTVLKTLALWKYNYTELHLCGVRRRIGYTECTEKTQRKRKKFEAKVEIEIEFKIKFKIKIKIKIKVEFKREE
jgi:hypothetical protein